MGNHCVQTASCSSKQRTCPLPRPHRNKTFLCSYRSPLTGPVPSPLPSRSAAFSRMTRSQSLRQPGANSTCVGPRNLKGTRSSRQAREQRAGVGGTALVRLQKGSWRFRVAESALRELTASPLEPRHLCRPQGRGPSDESDTEPGADPHDRVRDASVPCEASAGLTGSAWHVHGAHGRLSESGLHVTHLHTHCLQL